MLIAPFRGVRYNLEKIGNLWAVVAPPYDVISPEARERYYARHEHNIIRLILGKELPGDDEGYNQYTRASLFLRQWQEEGVLVQDPIPSLYLYEQRFVHPRTGQELRRRGVIALVKLEPFGSGVVFPHERTLAGPKQDRLLLIRACQANLSPVFAFYPDLVEPVSEVFQEEAEKAPAAELLDEEGVGHRLWLLQDREKIRKIAEVLEGQKLFIADGHHRYETALRFRDESLATDPSPPSLKARKLYNYVMTALVSAHDPGLVILPTHRLIRAIPYRTTDTLLEELHRHFQVEVRRLKEGEEGESVGALLEEMGRLGQKHHVVGMYDGGTSFYLLTVRDESFPGSRSLWLDVMVLHSFVLENLLGLAPSDERIAYTRDEREAIHLVMAGRYRLAFFLNPLKVADVQAAAESQERLPPKSTFFYPKLLSGLVIHQFDRDSLVAPV